MPERAYGPGSWMSPFTVLSGAALLLWPMAVAWANPASVDVFANSRYSDNIDKRENNVEDDFESTGWASASIKPPGQARAKAR